LPLLIIGTFRNDEAPGLPERLAQMQHIELERLTRREIRDLSVSILGKRIGTKPNLLALLERETEGNVFFLVEVVRVLAEEAGNLGDIGSVTLPDSVFSGSMRTVIERRLSRLPIDAHPMLRLAAVFGRQIDLDILQDIDPVMDYERWLLICANAAILEAQGNTWRFSHDRIRDGILDMLDPTQVPKLNAMIAEAIENVYAGDMSYAERLTNHWGLAQNPEKEAHYAYIAGRQAFNVTDYQTALELFTRSASITRQATPAKLFIDQGDIHYQLGNFKPARASLKMALQRDMSDEDRITVLTIMGNMALEKGNYYRAERMLQEAAEIARANGQPQCESRVLGSLGQVMLRLDDQDSAKQYLYRASKIAREIKDLNRLLYIMNLLGRVSLANGDVEHAATLLEEAYHTAVSSHNLERVMNLINSMGLVAITQGNLDVAEKRFLEAIGTAYKLGQVHYLSSYVNNLARVRILRGDLAIAEHDLHEALERALELDLMPLTLTVMISYAIMFNIQGDRTRALRIFGLVQQHPAFNPEIRQEIATYQKRWQVTDHDITQATTYHNFEHEVSRLLGRTWHQQDNQ